MPRVGLTRERVLDLADRVVTASGELSLGAIAAEAGVKTPSLYKHVDGLAAVEEGLTLRAYAALDRAFADASGVGVDALVDAARRWRAWTLAHPGAARVSLRTHLAGTADVRDLGERTLARVFAALAAASVPEDARVDAARGVRALLHGFVQLEAHEGFGLATPVERSFERSVRALLDGFTR